LPGVLRPHLLPSVLAMELPWWASPASRPRNFQGLAIEPGLQDAYDKAQAMAWNFFSAKCGKRRTTQEEIDYYDHVLTEWRTLKRHVQ
jgi:hypothetical protein